MGQSGDIAAGELLDLAWGRCAFGARRVDEAAVPEHVEAEEPGQIAAAVDARTEFPRASNGGENTATP